MYRILSEKNTTANTATGTTQSEAELIVSSSEDIPDYNEIPGRVLLPGSAALVPSESKIFVLDLDNEWKEWGGEA